MKTATTIVTEARNPVRDALDSTVERWSLIGQPALLERIVAKHGVPFTGAARPKGYRRQAQKMCFRNSALLCVNKGLDYYEGFALHRERPWFPFLHAWNVDAAGRFVDVTLLNPEEYDYLGIRFPLETLCRELLKSQVYGILDTGLVNVDLCRDIDAAVVAEATAIRKLRGVAA